MLIETVQEILTQAGLMPRGVIVEISVPHGAELAQKTLNPRLGILDGISILGTTGIVVPYSTAAWEASVLQNIDVAVAQGCKQLVFIVGGRGERFAQRLFALPDIAFVQIGDFFGQAFRHAAEAGAQHVTLASMIGKLAKFAAGHELVHSRESSQDFHFLGELARQAGAAESLIRRTCGANTAQEVSELMSEADVTTFHDLVCRAAWEYAASLMHGVYTLEVMLLSRTGKVLGSYDDKHGAP